MSLFLSSRMRVSHTFLLTSSPRFQARSSQVRARSINPLLEHGTPRSPNHAFGLKLLQTSLSQDRAFFFWQEVGLESSCSLLASSDGCSQYLFPWLLELQVTSDLPLLHQTPRTKITSFSAPAHQ